MHIKKLKKGYTLVSSMKQVRVMEIFHRVDGRVDVPHSFLEEIVLYEHKIIDMKVTAILPNPP